MVFFIGNIKTYQVITLMVFCLSIDEEEKQFYVLYPVCCLLLHARQNGNEMFRSNIFRNQGTTFGFVKIFVLSRGKCYIGRKI